MTANAPDTKGPNTTNPEIDFAKVAKTLGLDRGNKFGNADTVAKQFWEIWQRTRNETRFEFEDDDGRVWVYDGEEAARKHFAYATGIPLKESNWLLGQFPLIEADLQTYLKS